MRKITPSLYGMLQMGGYLNSYLLDTGHGLAMLDFGTNTKLIDQIEQALPAFGWSLADIRYALVTHAHYDHIGALAELQRRADVTTYAGAADAPVIRGEQPCRYADPATLPAFDRWMAGQLASPWNAAPAVVDVLVNDGDALDAVYPGLQAVALPGHCDGQMGYWLANERILLAGDTLMNTPFRLTLPLRAASPDWAAVKQSVRKAAALKPEVLCVGHGLPVQQQAHQALDQLAQRI